MKTLLIGLAALVTGACASMEATPAFTTVGTVHRDSPALDALVPAGARIEKLADGFQWSEGPVWIADGQYLLFSDVPQNTMYRWSERDGVSVFLKPSGYAGPPTDMFREPGSNGLIKGPGNTILMADHGNRAVARLDLATKQKTFLATQYQGKKFNSPNDLALGPDGSIYFTDPPYGLEGMNQSPHKEQPVNGVYRLRPGGEVDLLDGELTFPNGIVFAPDYRTMYVAVSDPDRAQVFAYDVGADGRVSNKRVFADMTALAKSGLKGLPDGMTVDGSGNLFVTGPGGVHIFTPAGERLGRIDTGTAVANVAFGEDGRTLFLTSHTFLARVRTATRTAGPK